MTDILSRLIPKPRQLDPKQGRLPWSDDLAIILEPANEADRFAAETLVEACRERGLAAPRLVEAQEWDQIPAGPAIFAGDPARCWPLLEVMQKEGINLPRELANDGYLLQVAPERILLAANTPAGVYYGFQTLIQLLPQAGETGIPAVEIRDWTDMKQRGAMTDLFGGEVYTLNWFKKTAARLGHYKLNLLVLYFEDAFLFPSHPDIGEHRDRLTPDEARELVAFAAKHHVDVVPSYNSPAHMPRTLLHPNYTYLAEGEEKGSDVINVTHPDTYPLLYDLYGDLCDVFPSQWNYLCGDEVGGMGKGKSKPAADRVGARNLYLRHLKLMHDFLAKRGRRMSVAGDPFEPGFFRQFGLGNFGLDALAQLPRDIVVFPWHYGKLEEFPFGPQLNELGFEWMMWTSNAAYLELYPSQNASAGNVMSVVPFAHQYGALGGIHSDWNGYGENTFSEYNWPSIIFYSEWIWASPGRNWKEGLPVVLESWYGPGTGGLSETVVFLGNLGKYFGWGGGGMTGPAFPLFFGKLAPRALDEKQIDLLADFRKDLASAQGAFEQAKGAATRNVDHLDYLGFALAQYELLGNLIELRHFLAQSDAGSKPRLTELRKQLSARLPAFIERYAALWLRTSKPLGFVLNRERMEGIRKQVDALE